MYNNKVAIITGGSKGIGLAIAKSFASIHFDIVISGRNSSSLENAFLELKKINSNCNITTIMADMSLQSGINTFLKQVKEKYQAIDVLVNNVGVFKPGKLMEEPEDQLEILLQTNVISMHKTTRGVLPLLKQSDKAHIFNICSIASKAVLPNSASYCASKAAMYMYSQSLKVELRPFKIRVTSVLPGATYTDSWLGSGVGAERMMDVADIAQMVISAYNLPLRSNIDEIEMRPIGGDI